MSTDELDFFKAMSITSTFSIPRISRYIQKKQNKNGCLGNLSIIVVTIFARPMTDPISGQFMALLKTDINHQGGCWISSELHDHFAFLISSQGT